MVEIIKQIEVDVAKRNTFQAIVAKQGDTASRFLKVRLTNEGEPLNIPTGSTATINAERSDGNKNAFLGTVNTDGTVTVPLSTWMLAIDGQVNCSVSIVDSESRKLTSTSFSIQVEYAEYSDEEIVDEEEYGLLVTLLADVTEIKEDAITATNAVNTAISEANTATINANSAVAQINTLIEAFSGTIDCGELGNEAT